MSLGYRAVGWNRQKRVYDGTLALCVGAYLATFVGAGAALFPEATAETLLIRALGTAAFLCLHVVLCIGPLCRLDRRFLPLLYNRRHLGVATFGLALAHGAFSLVQFHALGDVDPFVSLLASNRRIDSVAQFPFQPIGAVALAILFLMAATSHDFWLTQLTAPVWKALHMLVYLAYGLVVAHVALGVLQAEASPVYPLVLGAGIALVCGLHLAAARRERHADRASTAAASGARVPAGFVDACGLDAIPEGRACTVTLAGERVAVFRYDGKVSAVSSVCQHQNGPLGEGRIVDGCITCPWHGYQYLPACGRSPAPFTERVPTFRVAVADGRVWVDPRPLPAGTEVEPAAAPGRGREVPGELYVGYLPEAPPGLARHVRRTVGGLATVTVALALALVAAQAPFGDGRFEYGAPRFLEGRAALRPVPSLWVERPGGGRSRYLACAPGKHGAGPLLEPFDGMRISLEGTLVHRDGQTMVEVVPGSVRALAASRAEREPDGSEDLGVRTFVGEIVDSKCFLGVMKPGNLKPHRPCAARCISGGVPPVLAVHGEDGNVTYLLLCSEGGDAVNAAVLDLVAEPVEITGRLLRHDNLLVLRADPETYQRIP